MKSLRSIPLTIVLTYCCGIRFLTAADGQESLTRLREIPPEVQGLIERACLDCHDQTLTEQQIRLDSLDHRPQEKFLESKPGAHRKMCLTIGYSGVFWQTCRIWIFWGLIFGKASCHVKLDPK